MCNMLAFTMLSSFHNHSKTQYPSLIPKFLGFTSNAINNIAILEPRWVKITPRRIHWMRRVQIVLLKGRRLNSYDYTFPLMTVGWSHFSDFCKFEVDVSVYTVKVNNSNLAAFVNGFPDDPVELCSFNHIFTWQNIFLGGVKLHFFPWTRMHWMMK